MLRRHFTSQERRQLREACKLAGLPFAVAMRHPATAAVLVINTGVGPLKAAPANRVTLRRGRHGR